MIIQEDTRQKAGKHDLKHDFFQNSNIGVVRCKLIILVENTIGIRNISQVHLWQNPRSCYSPNCVQGPRLQKAMETISTRYGTEFRFCEPEEAGGIITGIIQEYEQTIRRGD